MIFSGAVNNSNQMLKIEESTNNNCTTVVEKNTSGKISTKEHNIPSKNKNVFDRVVKTVGKVLPQKWNKKKVPCSSN